MLEPRPLTTIERVINTVCPDGKYAGGVMLHVGMIGPGVEIELDETYTKVPVTEKIDLKAAWYKDEEMSMLFIHRDTVRVYKYSNKELYKSDKRMLLKKAVE